MKDKELLVAGLIVLFLWSGYNSGKGKYLNPTTGKPE